MSEKTTCPAPRSRAPKPISPSPQPTSSNVSPLLQPGAVENPVADAGEVVEHPPSNFRITAVAAFREPLCPDVAPFGR